MHAKAEEVTQFLEQDLLPQVKEAFGHYTTADKAVLEDQLKKTIEQANNLGVDPETTAKVKDLRRKIADESVDVAALETEVYDHLYSFFRRYYDEGDFLAKRVYKTGVYAIPTRARRSSSTGRTATITTSRPASISVTTPSRCALQRRTRCVSTSACLTLPRANTAT